MEEYKSMLYFKKGIFEDDVTENINITLLNMSSLHLLGDVWRQNPGPSEY